MAPPTILPQQQQVLHAQQAGHLTHQGVAQALGIALPQRFTIPPPGIVTTIPGQPGQQQIVQQQVEVGQGTTVAHGGMSGACDVHVTSM